jgi:hypothetical protein
VWGTGPNDAWVMHSKGILHCSAASLEPARRGRSYLEY